MGLPPQYHAGFTRRRRWYQGGSFFTLRPFGGASVYAESRWGLGLLSRQAILAGADGLRRARVARRTRRRPSLGPAEILADQGRRMASVRGCANHSLGHRALRDARCRA